MERTETGKTRPPTTEQLTGGWSRRFRSVRVHGRLCLHYPWTQPSTRTVFTGVQNYTVVDRWWSRPANTVYTECPDNKLWTNCPWAR